MMFFSIESKVVSNDLSIEFNGFVCTIQEPNILYNITHDKIQQFFPPDLKKTTLVSLVS